MDGAGKINGIRALIMGAAVAVFGGCLLIWVMAPTAVYKQTWLPQIRADTNSTYFGTQGAMILLYSFPILFIAVLGCAYLHLATTHPTNSITESNHKWHKRLAVWKRPMIVKGLGIVSRMELAFFVMFIALLVWSFSTYLHVSFKQITPQSAAEAGEKVWESKLDSAALRLGLVGNICLAFMFFPVTRGSSVLPLFGLTSEASVRYHIWLGHIVMTLFTAHGICFLIYWAVTHQLSVQMVEWSNTGVANVPGELALLCGLVLWVTTFPLVRRRKFEVFFYTHHLYILFILFFILHVGIIYACMMLPGFYLFVVDRFLRFLQSRRGVRLVSARILPCETVELNFSKGRGLSYTPTSTMFVNVPGISKLQWHPFTVSSSSNLEPEKLSVIIKGEGSWSKKLYQMVSSPSSLDHLAVSTEGPYGPVSTDFLRHDILVVVSGGSGVTPLISITRELMFLSETLKQKTPKLLFICAFRNSADLTMLDLLLPISGSPLQFPNLDLQIEAYVTREKEPTTGNQKLIRTVWFKPKASDSLISPVLGPNSWLWLGAIITSSFIIFLLFMGILTRYYIYPIDQNTNKVYSYSSRAVLNILFICICIASTATAAFYWNKKQGVRETNQILNMEGATPVASPTSSWLYNADRELESLPQQTLFQSTKVQYGERPDLKKILFKRKEASIGVLVSGPNRMRHEVAKICSSGLADNLHFESISFTW